MVNETRHEPKCIWCEKQLYTVQNLITHLKAQIANFPIFIFQFNRIFLPSDERLRTFAFCIRPLRRRLLKIRQVLLISCDSLFFSKTVSESTSGIRPAEMGTMYFIGIFFILDLGVNFDFPFGLLSSNEIHCTRRNILALFSRTSDKLKIC